MKHFLLAVLAIISVSACVSEIKIEGATATTVPIPELVRGADSPATTAESSAPVGGSAGTTTTLAGAASVQNSCPVPHGAGNYVNGLCSTVSCDSDYYNCDGNNVNGCEATTACPTTTTSAGATTTTAGATATSALGATTTTSSGATTTAAGATTTAAATTTTGAATTSTAAATTTAQATTSTAAPTTTLPPTTTTTIDNRPDLSPTYVGKAQAGGTVRIDFTINNGGNTVANAGTVTKVEASIQAGPTVDCTDSNPSLITAGGSYSGSCFLTLSVGTWSISITADSIGAIDERSESNNVASNVATVIV